MTVLQFEEEVNSMKTSWKYKMCICFLVIVFYTFCGICFDIVKVDLLFDATINEEVEGSQTFVENSAKKVLFVGLDALRVCESELCFHGRTRTVRGRFFQWFLAMLCSTFLLHFAYVCRHLLELSHAFLVSAMRNIIFYIHRQDGKKEVPIFF